MDHLLITVAPNIPPTMARELPDLDLSPEGIADEVVRAGFEDSPYYRPRERATGNAQLIERLVCIAREIGHEIISPAAAREAVGLPSRSTA